MHGILEQLAQRGINLEVSKDAKGGQVYEVADYLTGDRVVQFKAREYWHALEFLVSMTSSTQIPSA